MSKPKPLKAIRGMNDTLPMDSARWSSIESHIADVVTLFGYQEIRTPVLESTHLFARSMGADTDIVSKEMYTFEDRNGDSLTLRPEGTAPCVRAGIEHGLLYNQQQRLWYKGPMFRHERPQKGRYRQFHQLGVECYGWSSADIEAEVIDLARCIFERLGLSGWRLEINSLGDTSSRAEYRTALKSYFSAHFDALDADSQRRIETNPLRILDSKNAKTRAIAQGAPSILAFLSDESQQHFADLQQSLTRLGIPFEVNPAMVRGLDYYNDTVFEFICDEFGAQSTVCGGGRYDGLVAQLGGHATPAFGFGMGLERLVQLLTEQGHLTVLPNVSDVYLVSESGECRLQALALRAELIRSGIASSMTMGDASFKNQFKRADKSGAKIALVIGPDELEASAVTLKWMGALPKPDTSDDWVCQLRASDNQQIQVALIDVAEAVTNLLDSL